MSERPYRAARRDAAFLFFLYKPIANVPYFKRAHQAS